MSGTSPKVCSMSRSVSLRSSIIIWKASSRSSPDVQRGSTPRAGELSSRGSACRFAEQATTLGLDELQRALLLVAALAERPGRLIGDGQRRRELERRVVERQLEVFGRGGGRRMEGVSQPRHDDLPGELVVVLGQGLERSVTVRARLEAERAEGLLGALRLRLCLPQVLAQDLGEPLVLDRLDERRQDLEREHPLDPDDLPDQLVEEIARVAQLLGDVASPTRFPF